MTNETMKDGERAAFEEIRSALDEIYKFSSTSPRARDNINFIYEKLDEIEARAAFPQSAKEGIPDDCDVRKILLRVVPGDGSGHEVYAKNVGDVEQLLAEMGERLEERKFTQADMERYGKCYADARDARRAAAPQAALTDEQVDEFADWLRFADAKGLEGRREVVRAIARALTQAPTERMSDAALDGENHE